MVHRPDWFRDGSVFVSYATTVGINKDGEELYVIDVETGSRTDEIDDKLADDVKALVANDSTTSTSRWIPAKGAIGVPVYYDERTISNLVELLESPELAGFESCTVGELIDSGEVLARAGHGSPSADFRTGHIPYIKVSDIRAGQVNINPTNRVSEVVARKFWKDSDSGLQSYDLITPIRTSKNIGDFAVIMPGQERVVLTKEVLVLRAAKHAGFDNFYLLWALSLWSVRRQWDRVVFMQTNREDVGSRYREIRIPIPPSREIADKVSRPFRDYYIGSANLREKFLNYLALDGRHHIFMSSAEAVDEESAEASSDEVLDQESA